MLRSLISVSALALMSSAALAADLPVFQPGPVMTAPVPMAANWTGFYVGVQGGYAFGGDGGDVFFDSDGDDEFDEEYSGDDRDGFTIGAKIGYDVQVNRFVVGAVADLNYLEFDSDFDFEDDATDASLSISESIDWFATLRGRAGFLVTETVLLYGHAGLAYASTDSEGLFRDRDDEDDSDFGDDGDNELGWTIGAGVEAAVTQNIRVGLEYSYLNFGDGDDDDDDGSDDFRYEGADADFQTIRASVSYKF